MRRFLSTAFLTATVLLAFVSAQAGSTFAEYEGRPITSVEIAFEGSPAEPAAEAEFLSIVRVVPNTQFSAVNVRDSLQALFDSERVANARVEVIEPGSAKTGPIRLRFVIQRQVQIGDVKFELTPATGTPILEDELRARVNLALALLITLRNAVRVLADYSRVPALPMLP